jgi:hypothetical protein
MLLGWDYLMNTNYFSPYLDLLRNRIDIKKVPFTDRGSRLLIFQNKDQDRLFIKLAERLTSVEPGLEAYLKRPPFIFDLMLIDEHGNEIPFETVTYPHIIFFQTHLGSFGLVFQDNRTLSFGLPPNKTVGLRFHVSPQLWKRTDEGGLFKSIRNLSYSSNGYTIKNHITPEKGGYTVEFIVKAGNDCAITFFIANNEDPEPDVQPFTRACAFAEKRWTSWFEPVPPVLEKYQTMYAYAWWIMAINLISPLGSVTYEAMMPSKMSYVGLWLWDSAMHVLAYRHTSPSLAKNQILSMLNWQLPDGMLPDALYDEGFIAEIDHPIRAEVTKPPILAWAVLKLHELEHDIDFLKEVYIPLVRWNAWWFSMNDDDVDGLAQYNHPYSSGLDDNPLWDYGMPVESPDLNTYLCVQMGSLAVMAEEMGMEAEGAMWRRRSTAIVQRMIHDFWDEESGFFRATHYDEPIPVLTPFNLFPLWTGQLPDHMNLRLIDHLTNPNEFWGEIVIPSVAKNDPHFDPETMWRGPVWVNINYFLCEALRQIGQIELADELREKTLNLILRHDSIFEYYNALNGDPPKTAADIFGWSAAVFIDLAIQASHDHWNKNNNPSSP